MKYRNFVLLVFMSLIIFACSAPVLHFDQTCITCVKSQRYSCAGDECPSTFMAGGECLVTMVETGENIYVAPILTGEQMPVAAGIPVAIAKLNGKYYLTGNNFTKLWIIVPKSGGEAKYYSIPLPENKVAEPVFEFFDKKLMLSGKNYKSKYILDDDENWQPKFPEKGQ
jgi:hypothetical protein